MSVAASISDVVDFVDEYETITVIAKSNGEKLVWTLPFEIFEQCVAKAAKVVAKHHAAKVVPFRRH